MICPTEEEERYQHLFWELDSWDVSIKHYEDIGDKGFADHWRTKLARESSLTFEEAAEVKKVADQWKKAKSDEIAANKLLRESDPKAFRAQGMDPMKQGERLAVTDQAIAQLVALLGPKEFTKLDFYTRHMDDRTKAFMEASRQHAHAEQKAKQ